MIVSSIIGAREPPLSPREELTSRERVRLALDHQITDRVPIAMVCAGINRPAHEKLQTYLMERYAVSVEEYLKRFIDIQYIDPAYNGPALAGNTDIWGVRRRPVSYGAGEYDEIESYPLGEAADTGDLEKHAWPDTAWFDYSAIEARTAAWQVEGDYCLLVPNGNIFETAWYMRGFEKMLLDCILNPEMVHYIMDRVTRFYIDFFRGCLTAGKGRIDLVFTADDIGGQNGLLLSLDMWEEFIKPYHKELNAVIHDLGARVIYHTDGSIMKAVDGLIDMGIDVLQALQFSADGMDPQKLADSAAGRLSFEGGVSVQTTLPFGSEQQVVEEVRNLIEVLGRGGGYILGPSHAIQAGTPPENIVAMFDTAASFYPF